MHFEIHQESGIICIRHSPRTEKSHEITNIGLSGIPARADVHCDSGRFAHCWGVYTIIHLQLHSQTFPRMQRQSYAEIWRTDPVNKTWDNLGTHNYLPKRHFFPYFSHMEDLRSNDYWKEVLYLPLHSRGESFHPEKQFWTELMEKNI